ncbi:MAG: enoyl-CoA hydratase/isomerase family protein, partial [Mycobacterium sp.]
MTAIDSGSDISSSSYSGFEDLVVTLADGVLSVTLNRPDSLNSLTAQMLTTVATTLERAASDPRVRVVRLGGAGRGFCSGAGISEEDHANSGEAGTPAEVLESVNRCIRAIASLPQPAVAVVHGPAAGVGVSLALGAFFAGMILSESELSHRAAQETLPL